MFRIRVPSAAPAFVRLGAAGLAAVLVLGGCASSVEPQVEAAETGSSSASPPTGTANPSETPTPTAMPTPTTAYKPATAKGPAENVPLPVMPELAKQESKEGLESFAAYWFSLVNYGYETGDTSHVRELSGPECEICESFYVSMEKGYVDDDWVQGGTLTILDHNSAFVLTPKGRYQVILSIQENNSYNRGPNGVLYSQNFASRYSFDQIMEATYTDGRWIVDLVDTI